MFLIVIPSSMEKEVIKLNLNKYQSSQKQLKWNYPEENSEFIQGKRLEFTDNIDLHDGEPSHSENPYTKLLTGGDFDNLDETIKSIEEIIVEMEDDFGNISDISKNNNVSLNFDRIIFKL